MDTKAVLRAAHVGPTVEGGCFRDQASQGHEVVHTPQLMLVMSSVEFWSWCVHADVYSIRACKHRCFRATRWEYVDWIISVEHVDRNHWIGIIAKLRDEMGMPDLEIM
jgi:hypothetical protein